MTAYEYKESHASLYENAEGEPLTLCGVLVKDLPEGDTVVPLFDQECDDCWARVGR